MRLDIAITGLQPLIARLSEVPTQAMAAIGRGLRSGAMVLVREARRTVYAGHASDHLEGDTGRLRNSITSEVDQLEAHIGSNVVYARIHEFGGVIVPHGHPYLSIPIGSLKGSPRDHEGLHYVQSLRGQPMLVDDTGEPQYLLMQRVTIPPRPYLGPAVENRGQEAADEVVGALYQIVGPPQ